MSDKQLDIQVVVNPSKPDIQVGLNRKKPDLQIAVRAGGEVHEAYDGEYHAESLIEAPQIFPTKNKLMKDDFTVDKVTVFKVSNPAGGWTYYIGK